MSLPYNDKHKSDKIFQYKLLLVDGNNIKQLINLSIVIPIEPIQQSCDINKINNYSVKLYTHVSPSSPIAHTPITVHVASISQINNHSSINYIMFSFWISIYLFSVYIGYNI
jgi:hypothetical protein